jgi:hypothetical protein
MLLCIQVNFLFSAFSHLFSLKKTGKIETELFPISVFFLIYLPFVVFFRLFNISEIDTLKLFQDYHFTSIFKQLQSMCNV